MVNIKNNLKSHLLRTAIWQQPASVQLHGKSVFRIFSGKILRVSKPHFMVLFKHDFTTPVDKITNSKKSPPGGKENGLSGKLKSGGTIKTGNIYHNGTEDTEVKAEAVSVAVAAAYKH